MTIEERVQAIIDSVNEDGCGIDYTKLREAVSEHLRSVAVPATGQAVLEAMSRIDEALLHKAVNYEQSECVESEDEQSWIDVCKAELARRKAEKF